MRFYFRKCGGGTYYKHQKSIVKKLLKIKAENNEQEKKINKAKSLFFTKINKINRKIDQGKILPMSIMKRKTILHILNIKKIINGVPVMAQHKQI